MALMLAAAPVRIPADSSPAHPATLQVVPPASRPQSFSSDSPQPPRALNQARIHAHYHNGDFDKVLSDFALVQKSRVRLSLSDSIFMEKHLAVVYAANPGTRELGRYHMFKLLGLAPNANLIDLFVGEEVDNIFEKVKLEFAVTHSPPPAPTRQQRNDSAPRPPPIKTAVRPTPNSGPLAKDTAANRASLIPEVPAPASAGLASVGEETENLPMWKNSGTWIGGGAALALAAISVYYSTSHPNQGQKTYVVPSTVAR